mgnify:CR=1
MTQERKDEYFGKIRKIKGLSVSTSRKDAVFGVMIVAASSDVLLGKLTSEEVSEIITEIFSLTPSPK